MKGYWIIQVSVRDADAYKEYVAQASEAVAAFDGRFLVRGGECQTVEGTNRGRNVVVEFPDVESARACYHSEAYQAAAAIRQANADADVAIVAGA